MSEYRIGLVSNSSLYDVSNLDVQASRLGDFVGRVSMKSDIDFDGFIVDGESLVLKIRTRVDYAKFPEGPHGEDVEGEDLFVNGKGDVGYIEFVTAMHFHVDADVDVSNISEDEVRDFYNGSALFIGFPYIRNALQAISQMLDLPRTVLPLLKRDVR